MLSPTLVDALLRGRLDYHGVVITDALDIESDRLTALTQAVQSGRISQARLRMSVHRILRRKVRLRLLALP
jgi:beta-glucosidase-like glycosyl hydrolase